MKIIYEKGVFFMYIRKAVLSAAAVIIGAVILLAMAFLFCFTEIGIPSGLCAAVWFAVLYLVVRVLDSGQGE